MDKGYGYPKDTLIQSLTFSGNYLYVGTDYGVFISPDSGKSWSKSDSGITRKNITALTNNGETIFAGTDSAGTFRSTDSGKTWAPVINGLNNLSIKTLAANKDTLYAGTNGGGIFLSIDDGGNWEPLNSGLTNHVINTIAFDGDEILAGTGGSGVFMYNNSWTSINNGLSATEITSFISSGSDLFAGTNGGGVFLSTDDGNSWNTENSGLTNMQVQALTIKGNYLFAGTNGGGIFRSSDNGSNWRSINSGVVEKYITCLSNNSDYIYTGTRLPPDAPYNYTPQTSGTWPDSVLIYRSSDNGNDWSIVDTGFYYIRNIVTLGNNIFAAKFFGLFRSTDNGTTWAVSDSGLNAGGVFQTTPIAPYSVVVNGSNLFAGTYNGVYVSKDTGTSWSHIKSNLNSVTSFTVNNNDIFAYSNNSPYPDGVFLSTDNGNTWNSVYDTTEEYYLAGPFAPIVNTMITDTNYLFAGTTGRGVWKFPLSDIATSVQNYEGKLVNNYNLYQNYPNPFNPTTIISYSIPKTSFVTIKVYDILGREVTTLVDGEKSPGNYKINFNASSYSSGVYFYQLKAGNFSQTKKLILLK
jgi:photosystem II stability/assembly factor-like uncharacterized protein